MKFRNFHRILGLCLFIFLLNMAITGLMRANAKWWYWKDRLAKTEPIALVPPAVSLEEVFRIYGNRFPQGRIRRVEFKPVLGRPSYLLETDDRERKFVLMDGISGKILSPISLESAIDVARSFVGDNERVVLNENLPSFRMKKASESRPVFRILFGDSLKTEVLVDQETGQPIMVLDRGRRLGLWMVKLHELDFAGMSRIALTLLGVAVSILSFTGLILGLKSRKAIKKEKMQS